MMDSQFRQVVTLALAIAVVIGLTALAIWVLTGRSQPQTPGSPVPTQPSQNPAGASQPNTRSAPVAFEDGDLSFTALCQPSDIDEALYSIVVANFGEEPIDLAVAVRLSDSVGTSVSGIAEVAGLLSNEQREIAVTSERPVTGTAVCSIIAVETDRRIIRIN